MNELKRTDLTVRRERALLVGVVLPDAKRDGIESMAELIALAESAGAQVVDTVMQKRPHPDGAYYVGTGKARELRERADANDANVVIFDNELAPHQIRELEKLIERKILDRSELILDIFASRAKTREAKLQVELAQLRYTAPRLRGMWSHLERIAGAGGATGAGVVGGIGTRGPGESQIEIDRRIVSRRISQLRREIEEIDLRKIREVKSRKDQYTVALVGYTNSGKSTLMNALTDAGVYVRDQLFATLDTKTAIWPLGSGQIALVSDTVGFISDLPHHLVASFRATLEAAIHADLLFHVVDASSPHALHQIRAVENVLDEIGCAEVPTILLLNKMDVAQDASVAQVIETRNSDSFRISALTGAGLDALAERVRTLMRGRALDVTLRASPSNGKLLAFLEKQAHIFRRRYDEKFVEIDVRISPTSLQQLCSRIGGIEVVSNDDIAAT